MYIIIIDTSNAVSAINEIFSWKATLIKMASKRVSHTGDAYPVTIGLPDKPMLLLMRFIIPRPMKGGLKKCS